MDFPSKIDTWLLALVALSVCIALVAAVTVVLQAQDIAALSAAAVAVLLGAFFPVWLFATTNYRVTDEECIVRSGPFRWHIALRDIQEVRPTRNPLSSPALSLDRLEIRYAAGRKLMVSPRDRAGFLTAIGRGEL